jgi:hypothetical protein
MSYARVLSELGKRIGKEKIFTEPEELYSYSVVRIQSSNSLQLL